MTQHIQTFLFFSVNRIANSGFKPFEMLFKASRCDDVDLVKSFAGEFNIKLEGIVRACTRKPTQNVPLLLFSSLTDLFLSPFSSAPQHL